MFNQFLRRREERRMTRVHGDHLLAGQPLVHLLLKPRADGSVLEDAPIVKTRRITVPTMLLRDSVASAGTPQQRAPAHGRPPGRCSASNSA